MPYVDGSLQTESVLWFCELECIGNARACLIEVNQHFFAYAELLDGNSTCFLQCYWSKCSQIITVLNFMPFFLAILASFLNLLSVTELSVFPFSTSLTQSQGEARNFFLLKTRALKHPK